MSHRMKYILAALALLLGVAASATGGHAGPASANAEKGYGWNAAALAGFNTRTGGTGPSLSSAPAAPRYELAGMNTRKEGTEATI